MCGAGQSMARRRHEPLLCLVSLSYQQNADGHEDPLHEGKPTWYSTAGEFRKVLW